MSQKSRLYTEPSFWSGSEVVTMNFLASRYFSVNLDPTLISLTAAHAIETQPGWAFTTNQTQYTQLFIDPSSPSVLPMLPVYSYDLSTMTVL